MNIKEAIEHCWDRKDYPEVFRDDAGLDISIPGFITRGSWIRNNSPRTVTLDVTTYRGVSWNAVHYYGNIIIDGVSFSPEDSPNTYTMCTETYEAEEKLLFQEKGINWNDYPTKFKRGSCCIKKYHQTMNQTLRSYWFIDNEIPIFKGEDREYIEKLIA